MRDEMSDSKHPALNSAVFLAAATAFLYCVSTAFMGGYLGTLKLDADVLDRNFHQVLYGGFLISLNEVLVGLAIVAATSWICSHLLIPEFTDYLRKGIAQRRRVLKIKRFFHGKRRDTLQERVWKRRTHRAFVYAVLSIALILLLAHYETKGKRQAEALLTRINTGQPVTSQLVRVKIDDQLQSLVHLACGARNCAGYDKTSKLVYYYPQTGHAFQYTVTSAVGMK